MTNIEMRKEWVRLHKGENIMTPYYLEDWGNNSDTFATIETGRGFARGLRRVGYDLEVVE